MIFLKVDLTAGINSRLCLYVQCLPEAKFDNSFSSLMENLR
jgi:hypothetical protein